MQRGLHLLAEVFICTGHHRGGQRVLGDFSGQIGSGQHTDARIRGDFFEDFAHQLEGVRLNAFGQAHQHLAGQKVSMRRQHRTQGAGGQGDENQLAAVQCGQQVRDRLNRRVNLDAFEVPWVLAVDTDRLGLSRVAHPLPDRITVLCQQIRHSSTEAAASKNRNRLLLSHNQSI